MPFARVARHWVLQANSSSSGNRRDEFSQFFGLMFDVNFGAISPSSQYVLLRWELKSAHTDFFFATETVAFTSPCRA